MASQIIAGATKGAVGGVAEPVAGVGKHIIDKDPDVAIVPMKVVGYTGSAFIGLIFIMAMIFAVLVFIKYFI